MYNYECCCGMRWMLRDRVEPHVVTCPDCGCKQQTAGRRNDSKKNNTPVAGNYNNSDLNVPKKKKRKPGK
ncbi:hypothetical protein KAR91_01155 [Candidatus Pacearchaeota archaeon]|nr:hypothetical protein [Candidatus Pacearchaeota archaeon]